jgi:hypothetical protein
MQCRLKFTSQRKKIYVELHTYISKNYEVRRSVVEPKLFLSAPAHAAAIRYFGSGSRRPFNFGSSALGSGFTTLGKK